jgi:uncharacterized cupin superfamily protein
VTTAFDKRVISVAPGSSRAYDNDEWHDEIVVVERGEIELESAAGDRRVFDTGDVLCLSGLSLRALRNRGREDSVLVAVSRRLGPTDCFPAGPSSQ